MASHIPLFFGGLENGACKRHFGFGYRKECGVWANPTGYLEGTRSKSRVSWQCEGFAMSVVVCIAVLFGEREAVDVREAQVQRRREARFVARDTSALSCSLFLKT